jgi:hypothetical protein
MQLSSSIEIVSYYSGSEYVVLKRSFVDISYHPKWTHPFSAGVATFGSWNSWFYLLIVIHNDQHVRSEAVCTQVHQLTLGGNA